MTSNLFYQSRQPRPMLDYADGIYLYDISGKRYVDGSSGAMVSNIGHSNPSVLAAMQKQMEKSTFGYRLHFQNQPAEDLATKLAGLLPGDLNRVFFVSGGSEAVESATKLARQYAIAMGQDSRYKVISRFPSYHGCTLGALALTGYEPLSQPFSPMLQAMPSIAAPMCYLDTDDLTDDERGMKYANLLRDEIIAQGAETVLAFLMEPIGGASTGALVAPDIYYSRIREICDEFGVLLIYDEVMTGVARTGSFVAADHWGIVPDIMALSKGLGSGYVPLGATVAREHIVETVLDDGGFLHGFTYAGNPLACAAGLAVLEQIEELGLIENANAMGDLVEEEMLSLMQDYDFIGDVRGKGLLRAFELYDRDTLKPLPAEWNAHSRIVDICYDKGLIIYSRRTRGGAEGDHFLVCPPLIITADGVAEIFVTIRQALQQFATEVGMSL
jgi:adenosylmethionine-8-amino-7-oxononanoate aminotransferase